ncbi:MAG: LysM peptidoglycan-binding domain-containing protein [bacterium]
MRHRSPCEYIRSGIAIIACAAVCASLLLLPVSPAAGQEILPVSDIYIVTTGDTLWNISAQFLGDPYLWPALWQINPHIKDPHWIFPGEIVNLRRITTSTPALTPAPPPETAPPPEEEKPPVKVVTTKPEKKTKAPEIIMAPKRREPQFAATQEKIDSCSFLIPKKEFHDRKRYEEWGSIVDSKEEKISLSYLDHIYIDRGTGGVVPGQVLTIFRIARELEDNKWLKGHYYMIKILGKAQVVEVFDEVSLATITKSYSEIHVGDMVKPYESMPRPLITPPRMTDLEGKIIESESKKTDLSQYDIVFLNLGKADGIEPGNPFEIYRFDSVKAGPGKNDVKEMVRPLGELLVLRREERTATALITKSILPIAEGDRIRVFQN